MATKYLPMLDVAPNRPTEDDALTIPEARECIKTKFATYHKLLDEKESGERPLKASNISQALECNTSTLLPEVCIGIFTGNSNLSFCCGLVRLIELVNSENHSSDTTYQSSPSFGSSLRTGCNSVLNLAFDQKGTIWIRFSTKFSDNFNFT